ncbi:hypothetical protein WG66_013535 [Moniliophthora roreri]|nr:hypothetical protein WG66_013535 [Moniliophthora roreri]
MNSQIDLGKPPKLANRQRRPIIETPSQFRLPVWIYRLLPPATRPFLSFESLPVRVTFNLLLRMRGYMNV